MLTRSYIGTNAIGSASKSLIHNRMYLKSVNLAAGDFLASVDARLNTVNAELVAAKPVLYDNNAGAPGKLIGWQDILPANQVKFNGVDRWLSMPLAYYAFGAETVFMGFQPCDPGTITLAYETTGGDDRTVTSGGNWTIDPAAVGGSADDPGSELFSIRGSVISGLAGSKVGRSTVGGSWQDMATGVVYLRSITIPANSFLAAVVGHLRQSVANVPSLGAYVYDDNAGVPGKALFAAPMSATTTLLMSSAGRWLHSPVGRWFSAATTVWVGWQKIGNASIDFAFDGTGGDGGSRASASDAATWTAGDDDYSFHGLVMS